MPPRDRTSTTDRARAAVAERITPAAGNGAEIAKPDTNSLLVQWRDHFQRAMPKGQEATQLVQDAMHCLVTVRDLAKAEQGSIIGAVMRAAQLGLRPGVLGHCWPLPYWDSRANDRKGGYVAQLVIGYQGYVDLMYRSRLILDIKPGLVREADEFEWDEATGTPRHTRPLRGLRGEATGYYLVIRYTGGGRFGHYLSREETEAHRDRYAPRNKAKAIVGPWTETVGGGAMSPFDAMSLKTVLLQMQKWAPKSPEVIQAISVDGAVHRGIAPQLSAPAPAYDYDGEIVDEPAEQTPDAAEPAASPPPAPPETQLAAPAPDPAAEAVDTPPPDRADQRQRNRLHAILAGLGLTVETRREDKLAVLSDLTGRPIDSSNDLTAGETHRAAEVLAAIHRGEPDGRAGAIAEHIRSGRARRAVQTGKEATQ
jgi:recombination protein RecT